ncbi:MAG: GntR family transcriptional regulator [Actinobacteria bacterium]|nr:GntR family transcriptional regulator [Actinomycetota bacterium]
MLIPLNPLLSTPLYLQIVEHVCLLVRGGQLNVGDRLPSTRALADQLSVHRSTVINAYDELRTRGLIDPKSRLQAGMRPTTGLAQASMTRAKASSTWCGVSSWNCRFTRALPDGWRQCSPVSMTAASVSKPMEYPSELSYSTCGACSSPSGISRPSSR